MKHALQNHQRNFVALIQGYAKDYITTDCVVFLGKQFRTNCCSRDSQRREYGRADNWCIHLC